MSMRDYQSWGRYPIADQIVRPVYWTSDPLPLDDTEKPVLPYGLGRSYGDCCLNDGGILLNTSRLDRFLSFDPENGILQCEAGVTLEEILRLVVPDGWFLPVTPGTKFITVGGAVANDIHGKNHHRSGTFGTHTLKLELLRSDGGRIVCSPTENPEWFRATIGGLGLTGLITRVVFRLKRIASAFLDTETIKYGGIADFFSLTEESDRDFEHTVAWADCFAKGDSLGRGLFIRANHAESGGAKPLRPADPRQFRVGFDAPSFLLSAPVMKCFNKLFYSRQRGERSRNRTHYHPFFYPLDAIGQWNRLYGKRGFFQYQCVLPEGDHKGATREILETFAESSSGSFLTVLKLFGGVPSPGMLSFPRKGVTLSLDFPNEGKKSLDLMERLDTIVREAHGAVYPAKDARMSAKSFDAYFPKWRDFARYVDPKFSSSLWRRVTGNRKGAG